MIKIYVDDMRSAPKDYIHFKTVNDTLKFIRQKYKEGNAEFFLSLDNDAGVYNAPKFGGDYINILNALEELHNTGKMKNLKLTIYPHTMNTVARQNMRNVIKGNKTWMREAVS